MYDCCISVYMTLQRLWFKSVILQYKYIPGLASQFCYQVINMFTYDYSGEWGLKLIGVFQEELLANKIVGDFQVLAY